MRSLLEKLLPRNNKRKSATEQSSTKKFTVKKKEERKFFAGYFVIVISSYSKYVDHLGRTLVHPKEWCLGEVTTTVTFTEGQESSTPVTVQILNIPDCISKISTQEHNDEEWQAHDAGNTPQFENNTAFRDHRMLMRLNTSKPVPQFIWEKGGVVTITADLVHRATYANLMKLILAK